MNSRSLFTILVVVPAFFLVILGMRNPALDHSYGPKQRPRAVVEKPGKSLAVKSCPAQLDTAIAPAPVVIVAPAVHRLLVARLTAAPPAMPPSCRQSRSPPFTPLPSLSL